MSLERNYKLTPKQMKFAELVALEGYKLVHAWRIAYDTAPDTPMTTCRPAASKLAQTQAYGRCLRCQTMECGERCLSPDNRP